MKNVPNRRRGATSRAESGRRRFDVSAVRPLSPRTEHTGAKRSARARLFLRFLIYASKQTRENPERCRFTGEKTPGLPDVVEIGFLSLLPNKPRILASVKLKHFNLFILPKTSNINTQS